MASHPDNSIDSALLVSPGQNLGVVLVTIDSEANGLALARQLVESRLAACVSLNPVQSIYRWQDSLHHETEWQLVIKTDLGHLADLIQLVSQHHPYQVPEIIALPIVAGFSPYLDWLQQQVD
ncbi:MAG: divalent cation tolerance protein CutA [Cyanobacteria bacterium REEB459]|nr:divalent cation tolerance protein CutA [Cyanobacteria bacterium REEB459]